MFTQTYPVTCLVTICTVMLAGLALIPAVHAQTNDLTTVNLTECQSEGAPAPPGTVGEGSTPQYAQSQTDIRCPTQSGSSTGALLFPFASTLLTRIEQQRRTTRDLQSGDTESAANSIALGGGASADSVTGVSSYGRLSPFVVGDYSHTERDLTAHGLGYEQVAKSGIFGADYRVDRSLFAGATFDYLNGNTGFDSSRGAVDVNAYLFNIYGSKYWDNNVFLDGLASIGKLNADIDRVDPIGDRFSASADGAVYFGEVAVGYVRNVGALRLTPRLRILVLNGSLDAYNEQGGASAQHVDKQNFRSTNLELSMQADYAILTGWGVLLPSLNLAYQHEFAGAETVTSQVPGAVLYRGQLDRPDRNVLVTRFGVSMQFTHGWSAFLSYEHLFEHRYLKRDDGVLGVRYEIF